MMVIIIFSGADMAIELYWDNDEQTVMLCVFGDRWTWDELFRTLDDIKKVASRRDEEIGAILDLSSGVYIPGGSIFKADTRDKAKQMLQMGADSKGPIAIAGANFFIKTIVQAFNLVDRTALNDVYFADTLDEARQILARRMGQTR